MSVLVFDIETIPDLAAGRRLFGLEGLNDEDTARAMLHLRRNETGNEFLPHHLQRVVAISCVLASRDGVKVWSLGEPDAPEAEIVKRFFDGLDRFTPDLVSWNGTGFDLPVLHYRALVNGVAAPRYWETGDSDQSFRWNNYLSRYHNRHLDLMDVLSAYQPRAAAKLDHIAMMCGFPGKLGMDGSKVFDAWLEGRIDDIRNYCETDVINTYLVYLRFEVMRGRMNPDECDTAIARLRDYLRAENRPHFSEYLEAWEAM
ncbi:MAG TPA: 3'-5' exonuclease [Gammaproteobacteria bacterium]|nr:3'-5' exonuclease [Gammaproteobacteria bacterium]